MDGESVLDVASVAEVQDTVRAAQGAGRRLRVVGSRSLERFARQPQADFWGLISTERLEWIKVAARDSTVRVGAGVLLAELDQALAPLGLVWPVRRLEAPGTVGGLVGSGRGTTIAAQDGPARRWVLGARLVDGTGEVLTVGGATVKNSVGYGVTHALWGSEGRLGAMVELTLRVRGRRVSDDAPGESLDRAALDGAAALVRCEDLAPGTAGQAVKGMAGAVRAVVSSDGLRAVGVYGEWGAAKADASGLLGIGIAARVERGEIDRGSRAEAGCPEDPHPSPLPQGEGEGTDGPRPVEISATPLVGCAEDPSPQPSPPGEGERADRAVRRGEGEGGGQVGSGAVEVVRGALDPGGVFV